MGGSDNLEAGAAEAQEPGSDSDDDGPPPLEDTEPPK
jgi:hypothetical protein